MLEPHRRQIWYSKSSDGPIPGWRSIALPSGIYLHAGDEVRVRRFTTRDGVKVTVVGECYPAIAGADLGSILENTEANLLPSVLTRLAGRFHVFANGVLHRDAGGLLGLFFDTASGVASTSLALMSRGKHRSSDPLRHSVGIDWFPGPATPVEGIRRLLPSEDFSFTEWRQIQKGLRIARPTGDPRIALTSALTSELAAIAAEGAEVYLPLTAGLDSRTILAAALAMGIRPKLFTMDYPDISRADREIPAEIARRTGLPHRFVGQRKPSRASLGAVDEHTLGMSVDADRRLVAAGIWDEIPVGSVVLRGGCFEFGRGFYDCYLGADLPADPKTAALWIQRNFPNAVLWKRQAGMRTSLEQWVENLSSQPTTLDWRDRFYFEQRIGAWLSDIEQLLDLTRIRSIHPANSALVYGALDCADRSERIAGSFQKAVIELTWKSLLDLPFNPKSGLVERVRRRLRRQIRAFVLRGKMTIGI